MQTNKIPYITFKYTEYLCLHAY